MSETTYNSVGDIAAQLHDVVDQFPMHEMTASEAALRGVARTIIAAGSSSDIILPIHTALTTAQEVLERLRYSAHNISAYLGEIGANTDRQRTRQMQAAAITAPAPRRLAQVTSRYPEKLLLDNFIAVANGLDLATLAVIQEGRKRPRSLGEFRLIPLTMGPWKEPARHSRSSAAFDAVLPVGVRSTYPSRCGRPYIDTAVALGLVRGDWLVAVAGAHLDNNGNLLIIQLQDVSGTGGETASDNPRDKYRTGLHDGFLWRDTFVQAWAGIARQTGASNTIGIQASANNTWGDLHKYPNHPGYDGVARRLGFEQQANGDWTKPL